LHNFRRLLILILKRRIDKLEKDLTGNIYQLPVELRSKHLFVMPDDKAKLQQLENWYNNHPGIEKNNILIVVRYKKQGV